MNVLIEDSTMQAIADAIRAKNGTETLYLPSDMPSAILGIERKTVDPYETIIDYDFSEVVDGTIKNNGSYNYDALLDGTTYELADNKLTLHQYSHLEIPFSFDSKRSVTISFNVDEYVVSGSAYSRIMRADNDSPSIYYNSTIKGMNFRATDYACGTTSKYDVVEYYNADTVVANGYNALYYPDYPTGNTTFVLDAKTKKVTIYVNGVKTIVANYSDNFDSIAPTKIYLGDDGSQNSMNSITFSMFKIFDRALTEEEILQVIAGN